MGLKLITLLVWVLGFEEMGVVDWSEVLLVLESWNEREIGVYHISLEGGYRTHCRLQDCNNRKLLSD